MSEYLNDLGITLDDLKEPEQLKFLAKEPVKFQILSFKEIDKEATEDKKAFRALILNLKVMSGEHEGKLFDMFINKSFKETYVSVLKCFWTEEELAAAIKAGVLEDKNRKIGKTIEATPSVAKDVNGRTFQNFYNFRIVKEETKQEEVDTNF